MTAVAAGDGELRARLLQRLEENAPSFDFFQAVRLILRGQEGLDQRRRGAPSSPIRFRSNISFQFKASDVQSIRRPEADGQPVALAVNFLGIASPGVVGSLPNWYAMTALVLVRHHANIRRLLAGSEPRIGAKKSHEDAPAAGS